MLAYLSWGNSLSKIGRKDEEIIEIYPAVLIQIKHRIEISFIRGAAETPSEEKKIIKTHSPIDCWDIVQRE